MIFPQSYGYTNSSGESYIDVVSGVVRSVRLARTGVLYGYGFAPKHPAMLAGTAKAPGVAVRVAVK